MELDILIEILEASLKKNGDKPLTISHLLNIIKKAERYTEESDNQMDIYYSYNQDYPKD